jgi:hypothetical protein
LELSGQYHAPAALPPGKNPGTLRRLDGPQNRYGLLKKRWEDNIKRDLTQIRCKGKDRM